MKLTSADIQQLYDLLTVCAVADIEDLKIEAGTARGVSTERASLIISDYQVPAFPQKLGISRLGKLRTRLNLLSVNGQFSGASGEAQETSRDEISQLVLRQGSNQLIYRCSSTANILAPKGVNDTPLGIITVSAPQLTLLLTALTAMDSAKLILAVRAESGKVEFCANDDAGDKFTLVNEAPIEKLAEISESVVNYYDAETFCSIMRAAKDGARAAPGAPGGEVPLSLGQQGTLTVLVRGHPLIMLPQAPEK